MVEDADEAAVAVDEAEVTAEQFDDVEVRFSQLSNEINVV